MPIYKQSLNIRRMTGVRWDAIWRVHCTSDHL